MDGMSGMDHHHHDDSGGGGGGSSSIFGGPILPSNFLMQKRYWAGVGAVIAFATFVNLLNKVMYYQRISAQLKPDTRPAKPRHPFFRSWATITAITREFSSSTPDFHIRQLHLHSNLSFGQVTVVTAYFVFLLLFCFYKFNPGDQWQWEDVGYRTGYMSICQLPLIFLLAGKKNIIGKLTGSSYEKLNYLHRWVARVLFATVIIHMGYWFTSWARYDYIREKIIEDGITQKGLAAGAVLAWIVLSSVSPIRNLSYEIFVIQHLISFVGFLVAVHMHVPQENHIWIWISVGLAVFDRSLRSLNWLHINVSFLSRFFRFYERPSSFWTCKAEFACCSQDVTRVTIQNLPISWKPGQHVFLSCHTLLPFQSHPFTISSLPADGKMEFFIRAEKGGTRQFARHATKHQALPTSNDESKTITSARYVHIEGPYGRMRPLEQFDTVTLIAGSMGATFTIPLMRSLIKRWIHRHNVACGLAFPGFGGYPGYGRDAPTVTRCIRFVWIVRDPAQLEWFHETHVVPLLADVDITKAETSKKRRDVQLIVQYYITCDEGATGAALAKSLPLTPSRHGKVEVIQGTPGTSATDGKETAVGSSQVPTKITKDEDGNEYLEKEISSSSASSTSKSINDEEISELTQQRPATKSCGPDGTCCCRQVAPSSESDDEIAACHCHDSTDNETKPTTKSSNAMIRAIPVATSAAPPTFFPTTSSSSTSSSSASITTYTGRPPLRHIITTDLEQARGESAVVVCGPQALIRDVRNNVSSVSEERGVHKGTGALGVWVHAEGFGY